MTETQDTGPVVAKNTTGAGYMSLMKEERRLYDHLLVVQAMDNLAAGDVFGVDGYVSSSGGVADRVFQVLPADGYVSVLVESVKVLRKLEKPDDVPMDMWLQVLEDREESWMASIEGRTKQRSERPLQKTGAFTFSPSDNGDARVIKHLKLLDEKVLVESARQASSPVTLLKRRVESMTPLGRYVGRIVISPGKYQSITVFDGKPATLAQAT